MPPNINCEYAPAFWNKVTVLKSMECCLIKVLCDQGNAVLWGRKEMIPNQKYQAFVLYLLDIYLTCFNCLAFLGFEGIVFFVYRYPWHPCTDSGKSHYRPAVLHCWEIRTCFSLTYASEVTFNSQLLPLIKERIIGERVLKNGWTCL